MLFTVELQVASLAKGCQVMVGAVGVIVIEVGDGEYHFGKSMVPDALG
jgi:hypothetical protein